MGRRLESCQGVHIVRAGGQGMRSQRGGEAVHRLGLGWAGWNHNLMDCYLFLVTTMPHTRPGKCALDLCSYQCLVRSHLHQS